MGDGLLITAGASLLVALVGTFGLIIVKRMGDRAAQQPTVAQIWARMDALENKLNMEREARLTLRQVFVSYVDRVQTGGSSDLTSDERRALSVAEEPKESSGTSPRTSAKE